MVLGCMSSDGCGGLWILPDGTTITGSAYFTKYASDLVEYQKL